VSVGALLSLLVRNPLPLTQTTTANDMANDIETTSTVLKPEPLLDASELRKVQAALICEYGNLGWKFENRCELKGACPRCQERALKSHA
jgi:hypothetical protein